MLMNGTFDSSPSSFTQLFIVHGTKNHTYIPVAYFIDTGKTTVQQNVISEVYKNWKQAYPQRMFLMLFLLTSSSIDARQNIELFMIVAKQINLDDPLNQLQENEK